MPSAFGGDTIEAGKTTYGNRGTTDMGGTVSSINSGVPITYGSDGTQRLGVMPRETSNTGTVRLDGAMSSGTVRIEREKKATLILEESRPGLVGISERRVNMANGKRVVIGRADGVDVKIADETVSGKSTCP